jgi:uncharacterized membrane protein
MAKDLSDTVRDALGHAVRDAIKNMGNASPTKSGKNGKGGMSGMKGLAAGAGLAAAAPLAKKGVDAVRGSGSGSGNGKGGGLPTPNPAAAVSKVATKAASTAGDKVGSNLKDAVTSKIDEAGGAGGLVKEAASGLLPGGGDSGGGKGGMPGVGKGRRMPVQQAVDVAVPLETAYNQWTQFEDWPEFMHRVTRVSQEDDCSLSFATKIWGKTKEFKADIETQRPDERIKWSVSQGITHTGVVTFHELAPRLTRIELNVDVEPGSLLEKAARGMRHIKRAMRADLHRFKAFIEMQEQETGAWRGVIEEGELVEEHDPSYDEEREYSDIEEIKAEEESQDEDEQEDQDEDEQEEQDEDRGGAQRSRSRSAQSRRPSESRSSGSGSRSGSRSRSRGATNGSSRSSSDSESGSGGRKSSRTAAASQSSSSRTASKPKAKSSSSKSSSKPRSSKSSKSGGSSNGKSTSRSSKSSSGGRRKASSRS